ncbi:FkbM family methyltransferase [Christiangramia portivictoriae]|uniref:FkbM family methyltransferase n=1 Tax=Christiangramia portivictoriae TaxID=326069 RepID=UPI000411F2C6|nr:FkbM family methyltransferase [Christiangramia portivictoriae]
MFGMLLRLPFLLIPKKMVIPILSGPLRGKKWIVGSHNHSAWLGTYERSQTLTFLDKCKGQKIFWDLGAHSGYYTLLFKTINSNSTIYSFEPIESNYINFERHLKLNNLNKVFLIKKAVSDKEGSFKFARGNSVGGKLSETGDMTVPVVKLSSLLKKGAIEFPDVIKMDVEGAELQVLEDIKFILMSEIKPIIFLSTHGKYIHDACLDLINSMSYKITPIDDKKINGAREFLIEPPSL